MPHTFDGTGVLGVHAPVRAVDVVCSPTRNHPRAKLFAAQPARAIEAFLRMHAHLGVVDLWRGSKPCVIVEALRHRHGRRVRPGRIARQADLYMLQVSDATVAHELCGIPKLRPRALLAAYLNDAAGRLHRVGKIAPFGDGERSGFLQIDILASPDGSNPQWPRADGRAC